LVEAVTSGMKRAMTKKVTITILAVLVSIFSWAQQVFFIYIQTENRQPFYVRLNNKVYSSTAAGYLVLSKLTSGDYRLKAGFPKSEQPEMDFLCRVNNEDQGYALKDFADKGWGLFNLRSFAIQMPGTATATDAGTGDKNSSYANVLANVVKDPTIKDVKTETPPPVKPAEPPVAVTPLEPAVKTVAKDTPAAAPEVQVKKEEPVPAPPVKAPPVVTEPPPPAPVTEPAAQPVTEPAPPPAPTAVTRIFTFKGSQGTDQVYTLQTAGITDTVRIFIPKPKEVVPPPPPADTVAKPTVAESNDKRFLNIPVTPQVTDSVKKDTVAAAPPSKPIVDTVTLIKPPENLPTKPAVADSTVVAKTPPVEPVPPAPTPPSKLVMFNTNCDKVATEDDYIKLRKKMAGERNDDDMAEVARKAFKQRCFLVQHLKGLAALFSTDEGRYRFFDAAYAYTYDTEQFKTLGDLLKDPYVIGRFNAMIRK
jgi:hypothetical protein